jgi:PhoD-like phosphatase
VTSDSLLLGPLLRYVDETTASVWVKTRDRCDVTVRSQGRSWGAKSFTVHGHHYALVEVDGLEPGSSSPYTVEIGGEQVWPEPGSSFPPSRIVTLQPGQKVRMAFGSCRKSAPHDEENTKAYGIDSMRAYALHMMADEEKWPDLIVFLGDQVYADETSDEMREFIASRRDIDKPPKEELKDYEEYAYLYHLAWTDPANRWLLSTLPSSMIFDDHDIRDDWNTSAAWREQMNATQWWKGRIVAGLASYWVYQHLGNLSPAERAGDEMWKQVLASLDAGEEVDLGPMFDEFAARVDVDPDTYRWSFSRDLGSSRLIVVDSRAARVLSPDDRQMLDNTELTWLDEQLTGGFDHLFIGTSLPYLMAPGLHDLEAWDEAVAAGAWGKRLIGLGERIRQGADLEHWAAFQESFRDIAELVGEVASGKRGEPPATVTFLSGDVHNSYLAEVDRPAGATRILQAVCSPIRNPLPALIRGGQAFAAKKGGTGIGRALARSVRLPEPPLRWHIAKGPWFDNNLATLEAEGRSLSMWWERGVLNGGDPEDPEMEVVSEFHLDPGAGAA